MLLAASAVAAGGLYALRIYNSAPAISELHARERGHLAALAGAGLRRGQSLPHYASC